MILHVRFGEIRYILSHNPNSIRNKVCSIKDVTNSEENKKIVYNVVCYHCDAKFIGESSRSAGQRLGELQKAFPKKMQNCHVNRHCMTSKVHTLNFIEGVYTMFTEIPINRASEMPRC